MKTIKIALLISAALSVINCSTAAPPTTSTTTNTAVVKSDNSAVISSHSDDPNKADSKLSNQTSSTESPMARAIDVTQFNAEIERAANNPKDKKALARAYFKRAFALTEAAQYRSALGDFRRGLNFDPGDAEAKGMHDKIIEIFASINREPPTEGEEPPPLPFDSGKSEKQKDNPANEERITFKPNQTEATASGNLNDYDDAKTFVIAVKSGQTLKTEQPKANNSTRSVMVAVTDPQGNLVGDADASCNNRREIAPTVTGDYQIKVVECRKADAWKGKFDLNVAVK